MRTILLAALPLLLASCAIHEHFDIDASTAQAWDLPVRFDHNLPVVEIRVGKQTVPVVVDTGCNGSIWLRRDVAERVGATFTGEASSYSDAHGRSYSGRKYVLADCWLGAIELHNVEGREFATTFEGGPDIQGIIGLSLLSGFRVMFDWPAARLRIDPLEYSELQHRLHRYEPRTIVPMRWTSYGIVTTTLVDGVPLDLVWDTGASDCILIEGRVDEKQIRRRFGNSRYEARHLCLASNDFGPLDFAIENLDDPPGDGIIGSTFFMKHRVSLNLQRGTLGVD